jgi:hypothetical protein
VLVGAQRREVGLSLGAGVAVDPARQLVVEAADHRDMLTAQPSLPLGGGGGRQHRGQRFAGQRAAFTQLGGVMDASGGVGAAG